MTVTGHLAGVVTHLVSFSTGAASAEVAFRVVEEFGPEAVTLLTADTLVEDEDNWRYSRQVLAALGPVRWVVISHGRTPMEIGRDQGVVPNDRMAVCSRVLKREKLRAWIEAECDPVETIVYLGYDWTEEHRLEKARPHWEPWTIDAPLCRPPFVTKAQILDRMRERGIEPPRLYAMGFGHANCFHPDTRFITSAGIRTLRECNGSVVSVLGKGGGWTDAKVESFGEQPLWELRLRRYGDDKTVLVTPGHLWPVRKATGRTDYRWLPTSALSTGHRLAGIYGQVIHNVRPSPIGVAAGFVFGDGAASTYSSGQNPPARAHLCGAKDLALLPYFASCRKTTDNRGIVTVHDLPRSWKDAPDLTESQSYLYGWLAGYFAADGTVARGSARIASASQANLEIVRDVAARLGIGTNQVRTGYRRGYGSEDTALYTVALLVSTLREDFFVLPEHRKRFEHRVLEAPRPADWQVVTVRDTGRVEQVMCAVVPDGHVFALDGNLLTHNCGGACVRGGQAAWELLLRVNRPRYLEWEAEEEKSRTHLGKDVSILSDRRGGGPRRPLPLAQFRARLDASPTLFDGDDWGACDCMGAVDS